MTGGRRLIGGGLGLMSFSSGCVDILSYRFLGDVFTSAMTGNIALMGLGLGQGDLAAVSRNMSALAGFVGGLTLAALILRHGSDRKHLLVTVLTEAALLLMFALGWGLRGGETTLYMLIIVSALAMGVQTAIAHRIGMPGVATTYFSGTLTGIVFDLVGPAKAGHPAPRRAAWPLLAFVCYITGAILAGWYTAGRGAPELSPMLPALPCAAALALALLIVIADRED